MVLLSALPIQAQEYGPDSPEVEVLQDAYVSRGLVMPALVFPLGREGLDRLSAAIGLPAVDGGEAMAARWWVGTYLDAGIWSGALLMEPEAPRAGLDIREAWVDQAPFLRVGLGLDNGQGLNGALEMEGRKVWDEDWASRHNWPKDGGPGYGYRFESQLLARSVLNLDVQGLRFSFGRSPVHVGPAGIHFFYPTDLLPFLDALRIQADFGPWQAFYMLGSFHPVRSWEGASNDVPGVNDLIWTGSTPTPVFYSMHRLQYSADRWRLAVADQLFMSRGYLEFNDIFPLGTWHGTDFIPDNLSLMLDGSWAVVPGLVLHGTAAYDDISSDIFGVADSVVPTIDAYALAAEYRASQGVVRKVVVQAGYTHYLFGNYDARATAGGGWSDPMYLSRYIARYYKEGGDGFLLPFNTPYGPGARWVDLDMDLVLPGDQVKLVIKGLLLEKNTQANLISTPFERSSAVAGAPRRLVLDLELGVESGWDTPLGPMELGVAPGIRTDMTQVVAGVELFAGLEFTGTHGSLRTPQP